MTTAIIAVSGHTPATSQAAEIPNYPQRGAALNAAPQQTEPAPETIWCANMTAGIASNGTLTYTGYSPFLNPSQGELSVTGFQHDGIEYTVMGIYQQEFLPSVVQLVFSADEPLPDHWTFQFNDQLFPLGEATDYGINKNIHAWRLESPLELAEGDTVRLWLHTGAQAIETVSNGCEPFMRLLEQDPGDIERSGQHVTHTIRLETGKSYVVDMKGSSTGDGTLSDPWISEINGRFIVDAAPIWQPVWYEPSGRKSTWLTYPGGSRYWADENGRMHAALAGNDAQSTLAPVTAGNDDAGQGLNARLFLKNFPAGEYRVVVSGSPNPNDVGSYSLELTEISLDDYTNDDASPGQLVIGSSAAGFIETPEDADWFAVELEQGVPYVVGIQPRASGAGPLAEPRFAGIYNDAGDLIQDTANNHLPHGEYPRSTMTFTPERAGTYYVAVSGYSPYLPHLSSLPVGAYTVSLALKE